MREVSCIGVRCGFALIQIGKEIPRDENGRLTPIDGSSLIVFDEDLNHNVRFGEPTQPEMWRAFFLASDEFEVEAA